MTRIFISVALGSLTLAACTRNTPVRSAVPSAEEALLELARSRPLPPTLRSRLNFKLNSAEMNGSTGGGIIVNRPGNGYLAVLSPLGPLMTLHTNGTTAVVNLTTDRTQLEAADAESQIRTLTDGLAGVDEVLGLLVGQVPLDGLKMQEQSRTPDGDLQLKMQGPRGVIADLVLDDPTATPVSIDVHEASGEPLLSATYGPFEPLEEGSAVLLPSEVEVSITPLQATLRLRYKRWVNLGDEVPDVFGLEPPEGFTVRVLDLTALPTPDTPGPATEGP